MGSKPLRVRDTLTAMRPFTSLPALFRRKEDRWLRVDFSSWCGSGFGKEKFHQLKEAILAKKVIRFTYFSSENRVSERVAGTFVPAVP